MLNDTSAHPSPDAPPAATAPAGVADPMVGAVVYVMDDDPAIRRLVAAVLAADGIRVEACASGEQFLATVTPDRRGCLLLDVDMPGITGPDVQQRLAERDLHLPVVFLTGAADVDTSVAVMRRGAVDLIQKPFETARLVAVVRQAVALDADRAAVRRRRAIARARHDAMNPREREVMGLVVEGLPNKQIARRLDLSEKTIEVHRSRAMTKMGADSLADLVRSALDAGVGPAAGESEGTPRS